MKNKLEKQKKKDKIFLKNEKKQKLKKRYCVIFGAGKEENNFNSTLGEILKNLK
jgi:hypothetical protein